MIFAVRYMMDRDEAYPGEREDLRELLAQTVCDQLEQYDIFYPTVQSDAFSVWADIDRQFSVWDVETGAILEELEAALAEAGITDAAVYYEEACYGIAVDYQNWNGELSAGAEVWGDIQVQFEVVSEENIGGETFQWLTLYPDAAELENIMISSWYRISLCRVASEEQARRLAEAHGCRYAHLSDDGQYVVRSYELLDEERQEELEAAYAIGSTPDGGEEEDLMVGRIGYDTEFSKAEIYDVGQALCVGIFEAFSYDGGRHIQERLAAFFDFGLPYTAGRPRRGAAGDYQTICAEIAAFVNGYGRGRETRDRIHIVLSHWHLDHCILAQCLTAELAHTVWHVPCEGLGPSALRIRSHIVANGGKVEAMAGPFDALALSGNANLRYGKIDFGYKRHPNPAVVRASKHPHHHGMYMIVQLKSGSKLFLSGDCTYAGINHVLKAEGFTCLQASHHGGNYGLPPAVRNYGDIPHPAGGGRSVVCSCGPYAEQHHPNQAVLNEHGMAGWAALHVTHNSGRYTVR